MIKNCTIRLFFRTGGGEELVEFFDFRLFSQVDEGGLSASLLDVGV
jgi:hypothetical protein